MEITIPTPAPEYILGSDRYYSWRAEDFKSRFVDQQMPDYYLNYGDKYVQRFKHETRPLLSEAGQCWLDKVMLILQEFMEDKLMQIPTIELNHEAFTEFAFNSHVAAYQSAGFKSLPFHDLLIIAFTPDMKDLFKCNGRRQLIELWKEYASDQLSPGLLKNLFRKAKNRPEENGSY